ncbi:hypothetical protein CC2G_010236 [Coprinopsis cinerea AmutBmut pab1-1]|nr:hypothetical protein CC2G_010236 [Coprinopsis cinerea AmutBmut pab1-1]
MTEDAPCLTSLDYEADVDSCFLPLGSPRSLFDCGSLTVEDSLSRKAQVASCLPRHTSEATLGDSLLLRPLQSLSVQDMLCNAKATVVTASASYDSEEWTEERDNDVLREYFLVRTNIVLNSICPERAPHIVITPVLETPEDYYTPWNNRVDYHFQDNALLITPGFDVSRHSRMPGRDPACYWPVASGLSIEHGIPRRVFSPSRFNQELFATEGERLTMTPTVTALQRHRLKSVAIDACTIAAGWQKRYEDSNVLASIEKPFRWTDPAEPILKYANWPGVVLFESQNPFAAPHIMLYTPPQEDPWISHSNALNDPQDGGFGRYLVVPSRLVNFINVPNPRFDDYDDYLDDDLDYSEADSPPETPEPETPIDLEDGEYFPSTGWHLNDGNEDSLINETLPSGKWSDDCRWGEPQTKVDAAPSLADLPPRPSQPIFYMDDEEEEDLPPLDDWYLSVAARNGLQIAT